MLISEFSGFSMGRGSFQFATRTWLYWFVLSSQARHILFHPILLPDHAPTYLIYVERVFWLDVGRVAKHFLDSSMAHDLSSVCASCVVDEHNEKIRNVYSPRGSLIRFRRKKLLILDLNGLLADINMDHQNAHMAHAKVKGKLGNLVCLVFYTAVCL